MAATCKRCHGNGEIVRDWEIYLHGNPDDPADEGVEECPDCDGTGEEESEAGDE